MKMISFCNKKGGVGKTTLCKNVAYKLALDGAKVLLIDLDPQATLSVQFTNKNVNIESNLINFIPASKLVKINKIIQETKYKEIDIIVGGEALTNSNEIIKSYFKENYYQVANFIYQSNQETFDSYDYVLIDYPPTINDLSLSFLLISDLILIPINSGSGSYKGIIDLKNTLELISKKEKLELSNIKIVFNNVKTDKYIKFIYNLILKQGLKNNFSNIVLQTSDVFFQTENDLSSIWTNQHYWRQKKAYEELIKEIK
ncbi:ParA family protein [Spiroplasma endosymbiont of Megaselia nigra]|uniref:ParA family protein n=1 Tax=Spiroplasma endosymbiont of Megaselia nigra TaxID=2478537 RepID=UPI0013157946|nr:ParA family protein [Spiroplasma endosymbiont of Megaselia nigra]